MPYTPADDLYDLLSHHMLGTKYDPDSLHEERFVIDHLVQEVRMWEMGSNDYSELRAIFAEQNTGQFNLDHWIASNAANDGHYELPDELK
jgi:hypothetical protein